MARSTVSRSPYDAVRAARFGRTLLDAVSLNAAARAAARPSDAGTVTSVGCDPWTPVNAAASGTHLVRSVAQLPGNRPPLGTQAGVGAMAVVTPSPTAVALAATDCSQVLGGIRARMAG